MIKLLFPHFGAMSLACKSFKASYLLSCNFSSVVQLVVNVMKVLKPLVATSAQYAH